MNEDLNRTSKKPFHEIDEQKGNETDDDCALRFLTIFFTFNAASG